MRRTHLARIIVAVSLTCFVQPSVRAAEDAPLQAGFAEVEITPKVGDKDKPVYLAGFGQNRKATAVHDPLMARAVVLKQGERAIALVSVDLVGFFYPSVLRVREELKGFHYVLVSSTHNHEGPDTVGMWGPNPFTSGVDKTYVKSVEERIVEAVKSADKAAKSVQAWIGV